MRAGTVVVTPEEMSASLAAALVRHPDSEMCWTFVSPGPHGLPVRPRLLTEHANGDRVYSLSSRQVAKMLRLLNEASEAVPSKTDKRSRRSRCPR